MLATFCLTTALCAPPQQLPTLPRSPQIICCASAAPHLASLSMTAENYDALLLDQFGVIHDGKTAYDGAVAAVSALQRMGKKVVIISNSSRRRADTVARLRSMGFGPCEGDADDSGDVPSISVVTSGDLVFEGLAAERPTPPFDGLGVRCFVFGNGADDEEYVRECGCVAAPIDQADFILARGLFTMLGAGTDLLRDPFADYSPEAEAAILERALERKLPLLVANPDLLRPDGQDSPMPGQLAARYAAMGATDVRLVGKPHPLIYEACRARLAAAGFDDAVRVAAVGDSLHHDVLGASRNGVDSIFCCSGVHCTELGVPQAGAEEPSEEKLSALLEAFSEETGGVRPTHTLAAFRL